MEDAMSTATNEETQEAAAPAGGGGAWLTSREMLLLFILAAVNFTHIVDFVIIMPLGPIFTKEMNLAPWQFGVVVSAYTISAGVAGFLAARFLDRFDRKTALLGLYAGFIVGTVACALAPDFPLLLAARTVAGAFGGVMVSVVLVIVGDSFHDARRGMAMGIVMSAVSVASIAGVPLGLQLAEVSGWRSSFWLMGGVSAAVLVLAAVALPAMRGHLGREQDRIGNAWQVLFDANHLRAFALTSALVFSGFLIGPFLATFLEANVGVSQADLKYMYMCGGVGTLVTLTLFGRLADRFGKLLVFRILALFTLAPIVFLTNLPQGLALPLILIVTTLFIVTTSGRMVPAMALIAGSSAPACRGSFMSFNTAIQQLAAGLATSLAGLILREEEGHVLIGFPLIGALACVATVVSVVLAGRLRKDPSGDLAPDSLDFESR
jgi:predicted MFS family arabinose efflux permease